jgi:hypothetical protein
VADSTPKALLTEQAVKIPEELLEQLTVRVNHDHQPDDSGMWIASVSVFKVLRIVLGKSADLEQQLAHQMAANERMAAEKDQLSVELATLKAEAEKLKAERNLLDGALTTMQETAAESEELLEESEGRVNALKAAGNALLEQIEQGWEIFEPEAETLRALCGGLKPAESPR